jgi:TAG lipase/steryl ester hydrolase/phospholipase A2/LPA acyltransferase
VKTSLYQRLMRVRDMRALMFHLRQDLLRGHQVGNTGSAYRETVIAALRLVATSHFTDHDESTVSVAERIAFFNETRHSFGRSALLLSGGATMGMYHVGVVKALFEQELLPRVISGASAGSIVAALLGCRMDSELASVCEFDNINTQFFSPAASTGAGAGTQQQNKDANATINVESMIAMLPPPLPLLLSAMRRKFDKGFALDIRTLEMSLRENCGDYTFQEAYDRTGRIVNIVVTPTANGRMPMVLNYLTSPHVYMWSASLASCAVPGVFEPVELRARGIDGEEIPYFPQGQKWSDGSVENDLPMQRLAELFNVNHFIVSQVNPHALFLASTSLGSGPVARMIHFLKLRVKNWISTVSVLACQFGVPILGKGLLPLLTQKYEGDCTLVPRWGVNDLFELFKDPTRERFEACRLEGERITWPKIEELMAECKVERVMDKCTRELRAKLAAQDTMLMPGRGRTGSSGSHSLPGGVSSVAGQKQQRQQQANAHDNTSRRRTRVPSFHTSLSLLSIHDLDAGAPGPGGVRRRSSFSKTREV